MKFKIISFHSSPLDRQVSEAVRIARTGAEKILNCKGEFNRCQLPRMIAVDTRDLPTLGETEGTVGAQEGQEGAHNLGSIQSREEKKRLRKDKLKDLLRWGEGDPDPRWYDDVLSEGDEDLVDMLDELCEKALEDNTAAREVVEETKKVQTVMTEWFTTTGTRKGKKKTPKEKEPCHAKGHFDFSVLNVQGS